MLILGKDQLKDPSLGYARTFVRQAEDCLGLALEQGVRIVTNAGGLNPRGLGDRLAEVAGGLGLAPGIAYVDGDDLRRRSRCARARRRAARPAPHRQRLPRRGRDRRGAPRRRRRRRDRPGHRRLPGRRTGARALRLVTADPATTTRSPAPPSPATSSSAAPRRPAATSPASSTWPAAVPRRAAARLPARRGRGRRLLRHHQARGHRRCGHRDTVTAQLMYEVQGPAYLGPDVTTHLDSVGSPTTGPDRVAISGVRGSAPPASLKVCLNFLGGYRNSAELVVVGLDMEDKAAWARAQVEAALDASPTGRPAEVEWSLARTDRADADSEEAASSRLRVTVRDADEPSWAGRSRRHSSSSRSAPTPASPSPRRPPPRRRTPSTVRVTCRATPCPPAPPARPPPHQGREAGFPPGLAAGRA